MRRNLDIFYVCLLQMEHVSVLPPNFFAAPSLAESTINCNVDYYVNDLKNPTNLCVKQTGGVTPGYCCKYTGDKSNDVSKCWTICTEWEKEAIELNI